MLGSSNNNRILLHACCGPCAIKPTIHLQNLGYEVVAYFMNPNIHPLAEYLRRRQAMEECAKRLNIEVIYDDKSWNISRWLDNVYAVKDDKAKRCALCYKERLAHTYLTAKNNNFAYFSSSLLYSPYQNHEIICETAVNLAKTSEDIAVTSGNIAKTNRNIAVTSGNIAEAKDPAFFYEDFRKYWQEGIEISKEWNIYRQSYCACIFSEAERYNKKLKSLF